MPYFFIFSEIKVINTTTTTNNNDKLMSGLM